VDRTRLERNYFGVRIMNSVTAMISESIATGNSAPGFLVSAGWGLAELTLESCVASYNGGPGVKADGAFATARLSNLTTTGNAFGITASNGGTVKTFGNNRNDGNGTNGAPSAAPTALQ
jgi:nitrous oxidase accessory protein NosD